MVASIEETRTRSIVIVEDDEDIAESIRYNLEPGFSSASAATREDALTYPDRPPSPFLLD